MSNVPAPATQTTAIFGTYVLTRQAGRQEILRDRWVILEGNRIAAVARVAPAGADRVIDRPGRFILPGLLNLHNHCFSEAIARTHTEDGAGRKNKDNIVYSVLLPLSKRGIDILSPAERLDVARLGILQLLKGGATTVMEPFRSGIPEMFDAALEMGLRFYGAPYLFSNADTRTDPNGNVDYRAAGAGGNDGAADLARWIDLHGAWEGRDGGRIRMAMSPHATDTCDPDLLRACLDRAVELDVPITTHLAQSAAEVEVIRSRYDGRTPAEYLDWLGVLGPRLLAAHCIACTDADLDLMARRGTTVLNCPRVFSRSGMVAAFGRFAGRGLRTLVATDGYNMDLLGELNAAAIISKISAGNANIASAPELIDAVTVQAAAAIGRPDLGDIRPGATADLTVVDVSHPHLQPLYEPRRALVWLANRANVDLVVVDGRVLIEAGAYSAGNEQAITTAGAAAILKVWNLPEAKAAFAPDS